MESILSVKTDTIEQQLQSLGFSNVHDIIQTEKFERRPGQEQELVKSFYDPSLNPNGIKFRFRAVPNLEGSGYHIQEVIATKEFWPHIHAKKPIMIEHAYATFSGIPTKERITHEMLLQIRQERNKQMLYEDSILRKQLTKMGFPYDTLVANSYELSTTGSELKGLTILHEKIPILGNLPRKPQHVSFIFHLRKLPKQPHRLESIYTSVNNHQLGAGASGFNIEYSHNQGKFPTKLEMIENLAALMPTQTSALSNSQRLQYLINEASQNKRKNILRRLRVKR